MIPTTLDPEVNEEANVPTPQRHQRAAVGRTPHTQVTGREDEERVLRKSAVAHTATPR